MTENRRIILNIVATYGRSLYNIALGLFTCRWVLQALGHVDYGLFGVVGGMLGFVGFINGLFAGTISRYYAFAVGKAKAASDVEAALIECRQWFSVAVAIHTVIPVLLVIIGYPIGEWAVRHWLVIPPERIADCVWIWRLTVLSCFIGMVNVPFTAMYNAKQEIAELTIYSFASTTLNAIFMYIMVIVPRDWFLIYAVWTALLNITPQLIICWRGVVKYPECRFSLQYLKDAGKFRDVFSYAGMRFLTSISQMLSFNGVTILVNKLLGPARNAAMSIGSNLTQKSMQLMVAFQGALSPAITNAAGAKDYTRMRSLSMRTNVLTSLAVAVFGLPLILEVEEVMILWLKTPPVLSGMLCRLRLIAMIVDQLTMGHVYAIFATGKIFVFQLVESVIWLLVIVLSWIGIRVGLDIAAVGVAWIVMYSVDNVLKLYCGRRECGFSVRYWILKTALPVVFVCICSLAIGSLPMFFMAKSFVRLCLTTTLTEAVFLPLVWFVVLQKEDRSFISTRFRRKRI